MKSFWALALPEARAAKLSSERLRVISAGDAAPFLTSPEFFKSKVQDSVLPEPLVRVKTTTAFVPVMAFFLTFSSEKADSMASKIAEEGNWAKWVNTSSHGMAIL